jgi:hypothetical protein
MAPRLRAVAAETTRVRILIARLGAFDHGMYFDYFEAQIRILEAVKCELMDSPVLTVYLELHGD